MAIGTTATGIEADRSPLRKGLCRVTRADAYCTRRLKMRAIGAHFTPAGVQGVGTWY